MNKRNYEELTKEDLSGEIEFLEEENERLEWVVERLVEDVEDLQKSEFELIGDVKHLEDELNDLEAKLESKGITESRNFTIDNLYYLLCDRYGVSHHTSKDKLKALVDEELSL